MNTNIIFVFLIRVYSCPFVVEMKNPSVWISAILGLLCIAAGLWLLYR